MKDKQIACVILTMAAAACIFGMLHMQGLLTNARKASNSAKENADTSQSARIRDSKKLEDLRQASQNKLAYYDHWKPNFLNNDSDIKVQTRLEKLLREKKLNPLSNKPEKTAVAKDDMISDVYKVHLSFVEGYPKLFNWLSDLEAELPNCRITRLNVKKAQSEHEIQMDLSVEVPLVASLESKSK